MRICFLLAFAIAGFVKPFFWIAAFGIFISYFIVESVDRAAGVPEEVGGDDEQCSFADISTTLPIAYRASIFLRPTTGGFIGVVGESHYQNALNRIRSATNEGENIICELTPEPGNPHDSNAVRIDVNRQPVGYLCREDAKLFSTTHRRAVESNRPLLCWGRLTGGGESKPTIGVLLDFSLDEQTVYKRLPVAVSS